MNQQDVKDALALAQYVSKLEKEISTLRAQLAEAQKDAERWAMELKGRTNPEQHTADIDAAIAKEKSNENS